MRMTGTSLCYWPPVWRGINMGTLGERAEKISLDREALDKLINKYESAGPGTIAQEILAWLKLLAKEDNLGLAVQEHIVAIDAYIASRKKEILKKVIKEVEP